jgi:zinc protease
MVRHITAPLAAALLLTAGINATAQSNAIKETQAFVENGIHVIMAPASNQIVSVIIGLEGGVASGETDNPALAEFTSDLITDSGSDKYHKDAFRKFRSETSTTIIGQGDYRGMNFSMNATLPNFDKAWDVLASLVTQPRFDEVDFQNIQQRRILAVKNRWTNPESQASILADSLIKMGNPVLSNWTTEQDVQAVSIPMMQKFHKQLSERSRMLVIVVGNVKPDDIRNKLKEFAVLPAGRFSRPTIPPLQVQKSPRVEVINRDVVTTYIYGGFPGPKADEPDFWPLRIGMNYLRNTLWEEIRTKRNLSYAPAAFLSTTQGQGIGMMSVSTTLPDSSIAIMFRELEKMKRGEINEKELQDTKEVFLTMYYMGQMTNDSRARALYGAQRNAGDWRSAYVLDKVTQVTRAQVEKAFRKHAHNLQVGVVGKEQNVTRQKYVFGE